MTLPPVEPGAARVWWVQPRVVLPVLLALVIVVALLTPESDGVGRMGDDRLSSHLAGSMGARALHDVAQRFGWTVIRNDISPTPADPPGRTVHAVLGPRVPPTPIEAHAYLDAVRQGDAMLFVVNGRTPLSDSLHARTTRFGGTLVPRPTDSASCTRRDFTPQLWPDGEAHLYGLRLGSRPDSVVFARVRVPSRGDAGPMFDAATGFRLGRGRVVVVSDPDLLRNDVLRHCHYGADVIAMRMLEWLRVGGAEPRSRLVFDEYHQGYGSHSSAGRTIRGFLARHPVGRTIVQGIAAALLLLFALAPRPLPPRANAVIERRSPLEQVDALAHAYEQVGATRTATTRLLHGLRLRAERGGTLARSRTDERFLDDVLASEPRLADDVALVRDALGTGRPGAQLPSIAAALRRIEDSLLTIHA